MGNCADCHFWNESQYVNPGYGCCSELFYNMVPDPITGELDAADAETREDHSCPSWRKNEAYVLKFDKQTGEPGEPVLIED